MPRDPKIIYVSRLVHETAFLLMGVKKPMNSICYTRIFAIASIRKNNILNIWSIRTLCWKRLTDLTFTDSVEEHLYNCICCKFCAIFVNQIHSFKASRPPNPKRSIRWINVIWFPKMITAVIPIYKQIFLDPF